jgi:phosphoglycolate phosphatase
VSAAGSAATGGIVGFDLDMTLINSREAILSSFAAAAAEAGATIDLGAVDSRLGIKLEEELAHWLPADRIEPAMAVYRRHYEVVAGRLTSVLPGARESLAAVRAAGGRAVVISAKLEPTARLSLDLMGLDVDAVYGGVQGPEKGEVLTALAAAVYVGDTPADMAAAVQAGACPVGVPTGSFTVGDLREAGAGVILASLAEFPAWYARQADGHRPGSPGQDRPAP